MKSTEYDGTATWATQPQKDMSTLGKINTSDLIMVKELVMYISSRQPILKWASFKKKQQYLQALSIFAIFILPLIIIVGKLEIKNR